MNGTLTKNPAQNYRLDYAEDDGEPDVLFDADGNPTPALLQAFYEDEHGMVDVMTLDEFKAELNEICSSDKIV